MKENNQISGFYKVGNQPPVTWLTLNRIAKWEEEVLSTQQYVPYIKVKRSPTVGKGSKVFNPESDQTHEVLSILETQLLRYLAFVPNIISVKTQFPLLPISNTLEIAAAMGVSVSARVIGASLSLLCTECRCRMSLRLQQDANLAQVTCCGGSLPAYLRARR